MVLPEILRDHDALQRVTSFVHRYGSAHITLAMHASLPLGLTPDMLHLIRINFVRNAPWIAEADVLLSPLCREVGGEFYEMLPDTRELLLDELKSYPEFGMERVKEVAEFVYEYSVRAAKSGNVAVTDETRDFYQAQEWVALAYIRPEEAAQSLALALKEELQADNQAEVVRVAKLTQGLAVPLLSEEKVLLYSAGLEKLAAGEDRGARDFFEALGPMDQTISVGEVELPPAASLLTAPPAATIVDRKIGEPAKPSSRSILSERDWQLLLRRIKDGRCTPIIGPLADGMPLGSQIARQWASEYEYPFEDSNNLARVAQFIATEYDTVFPKEKLVELLSKTPPRESVGSDSVHYVLAQLPLPLYLSLTFDDSMINALRSSYKEPVVELCRWNRSLEEKESRFDSGIRPAPQQPLVFHFFGNRSNPESLVVTEDDYLDFIFNTSRNQRLIPPRIQEALSASTLLFIGLDPTSLSTQALLRLINEYTEMSLVKSSYILLDPHNEGYGLQARDAQSYMENYMEKYFEEMNLRVCWGTPRDFGMELSERWNGELVQ